MLRRSAPLTLPLTLVLTLLGGVLGVVGAAPAQAAAVSPQLQVVVDAWDTSPTREYGTSVPITAQTTGTNGFDGVPGSWVVTRNGSRASSGWSLRGSFSHALQAEDPAGTYVVEFSFTPDDLDTYLPETKSVTIERPKAQAAIDLGTPPGSVQTGESWSLPAGNPPHTRLAVRSGSTADACQVAGTRVDFTGAGTCTIDATAPENTNYLAATPRSTTFAVTARPQTFSASPSPAYIGDSWRPTASGGGAVTATSTTPAVCTTTGGEVRFIALGTCTVDVDAEATGEYAAAQARRSISVSRVPVTIADIDLRQHPDGTQTVSVRVTSPRGAPTGRVEVIVDDCCLLNYPLVDGVATGQALGAGDVPGDTSWVDARYWRSGDDRWQSPLFTRRQVVGLAEQPVTVEAPTGVLRVGDTWTPAITWTFPARPSSWSVDGPCERSGADVRLTGAGDCTLTAIQPGDGTAYVEGRATRTVTVRPAAQTLSADPTPAYVDDTWTPAASGGGPVVATSTTPTTCTASGGMVTFVAAGACVVDLSASATGQLDEVSERRTITVTRVPVTLEVTHAYPTSSGVQRLEVRASSPRGVPTGTVSWTFSDGGGTATLVDGRAATDTFLVSAGETVQGWFRYPAQGRWALATWGPTDYTADKISQTVAMSAAPDDARYRDTWSPIITWASTGQPTSWTAAGSCARVGDEVEMTGVGTCTVTAVQEGSTRYVEGRAVRTFAVDRARQAITPAVPAPATAYVGETWTPAATGGPSGQPVTLGVTGACAVDDGVVTFTEAGSCEARLAQAGDADHLAAEPVVSTTTVSRVPVTVEVTTEDDVTVGVPTSVTATATTDDGTVVPGRVTLTFERFELQGFTTHDPATFPDVDFAHAGPQAVQVSFVPDDAVTFASYDGADSVSVARGSQAIRLETPAPARASAGDTWAPDAAGGGSGAAVVVAAGPQDVCTAAAGVVTFVAAGACEVELTQAGSADYEPAPDLVRTVAVDRRAATLRLLEPAGLTVGEPATLGAAVDEAGTVRFALDGEDLGAPRPVVDGVATVALRPDAAGDHDVSATFEPAEPGVVAGAEDELTVTVARAVTRTTLTLDATSLTAVVAAGEHAGTPTGDVEFRAGDRLLGTADLEDGTAVLAETPEATWAGELTASYLGDADRAASSGALDRVLPRIVATVRAERPPVAGWYDAPVVVEFACTPGSAAVTACPDPVEVGEGADQRVVGAVSAADGARAEATVAGLSVDATAPTVRIAGVVDGRVHKGRATPTCRTTDALSGTAACTLTRRTSGGWTVVTARATDRAGQVATARARYRVARVWQLRQLAGVVGRVRPDERVWLVALTSGARPVVTGSAGPAYVVRRENRVHGLVRWHVRVRVPADARRGSTYAVTVGEERLRFRVR